MKITKRIWIIGVAILFSLVSLVLAQSKAVLWNGTHWKTLTNANKVAYIKGIGNMADFEVAATGAAIGGGAGLLSGYIYDRYEKSRGGP